VPRKSSDFTISLTMSADGALAAIVLAGDIDMLALPRLADAIQRLSVGVPENVTVDIAAVRFVGSVLPNFLVRVRHVLPETAALTVLRPSLMARLVLRATDMAQIATVDPPLSGIAEQAKFDRAVRRQRILSASTAVMRGAPAMRRRRRADISRS
jgi:anti-anti-sigma regulatory factor